MFVSFLLPGVDRGAGPLYHWAMLAQMARFRPEDIVFLGDEEYFDKNALPAGETIRIGGLAIRCPDLDEFQAYRKISLDRSLISGALNRAGGQLNAFRLMLCEPVPELQEAIERTLTDFDPNSIEAFLTWCNCPSLSEAAKKRGKPVIHNEIGPLRSPLYRETAYFDFRGVNGGTTPTQWRGPEALSEDLGDEPILDAPAVRGLLLADLSRVEALPREDPTYEIGAALQVEDDSNAICYSNGWDTLRLLYEAIRAVPANAVLVRPHPGAHFVYRGGLGVPDDSPDSLRFLSRCRRVISINSSVLAEAAFWEVPFRALGDCPVTCLERVQPGHQTDLLLNAYFLGYLIPASLLFDPQYYRWRIARARTLGECIRRHREEYSTAAPRIGALHTTLERSRERASDPLVRLPAIWTRSTSLDVRLAEAQSQLSQVNVERSHLEGRLLEVSAELESLRRLLQKSELERSEIVRDRDGLHVALNKSNSLLCAAREECARQGIQLESAAHARAEMQEQHGKLQDDLTMLRRQHEEARTDLAATAVKLECARREYELALRTLDANLADKAAMAAGHVERVSRLEAALMAALASSDQARLDLADANSQLQTIIRQTEALQGELRVRDGELERARADQRDVQAELIRLTNERERIDGVCISLQARLDRLATRKLTWREHLHRRILDLD